jgi:hypothetical protein
VRRGLPLVLAGALSCAEEPAAPAVAVGVTGVTITAEDGLLAARLVDPAGVPVLTQRAPAPVETLELRHLWTEAGTHTLELTGTTGTWTLSLPIGAPATGEVRVEAPVGEQRQRVADGERVPLTVLGEGPATVAVHALAVQPGPASIEIAGAVTERPRLLAGERLAATASVATETPVTVEVGGERTTFTLVPRPVSPEAARRMLRVSDVALPATAAGNPDLGRPADRVTLPGAWWRAVLKRAGLGFRPRDPGVPWSFVGVTLDNAGEVPANVVLRLRILDEHGQPADAFRPRLRGRGDGQDTVSALLRVPAGGRATAALPLYVDDRQLDAHTVATRRWTRELAVLPMGASEPLHVERQPLYVSRAGTAQSLGFGLGLLAALLGAGLVALRGGRWLRERPTSALMTIGLFSSLTFLVGAFGRVLTMGMATLLGPFATLLTGLVDDAFRYTLLATLVTLLPRPGTLALAVGTGWLLSGVAMGSFGPTDLLFLCSRIFFLEALLWLTGVTRDPRWRDGAAVSRFLRLVTGFGLASLLSSATGLALHMVLFRLFYADWYVAMILLGPGFLYVVAACAVAVPFAASLRKVQR